MGTTGSEVDEDKILTGVDQLEITASLRPWQIFGACFSKNSNFDGFVADCEDLGIALSKNVDHVFGCGPNLDRLVDIVTKVVDSS